MRLIVVVGGSVILSILFGLALFFGMGVSLGLSMLCGFLFGMACLWALSAFLL